MIMRSFIMMDDRMGRVRERKGKRANLFGDRFSTSPGEQNHEL